MLYRHTHIFHGHVVGLFLFAIIQLVGQEGVGLPAGVKGHTSGEHVSRRIHGFSREFRICVPAEELVAHIAWQLVIQRGIAHLMRGIGVAGVFALIAGEDQTVAVGFRLPFRSAQIHGDIHPPVGIQSNVAGDRLRKVKRFAPAFGVVVPAREGQSADGWIGWPSDGGAFLHIRAPVYAEPVIVVHEVHLIVARSV